MTQTKKENAKKIEQNISVPHWFIWLIIGGAVGFLGSFLVTYVPRYSWNSVPPYFSLGLVSLAISIIFNLLCLRDLIAEAHIKALEVFYGKKRVVKNQLTKEIHEDLAE